MAEENPVRLSEWKAQVQVQAGHYGARYDDWDKWTNYWWQIRAVADSGSHDVLEIGVGSRVVSSWLRNNGVRLATLDIDSQLAPDFVGSADALPFPDNSFDAIICAEVLEHMPFGSSCQAIREIYRVTRKHAFVTVPQFALSFAILCRLPLLHLREFRFRIPYRRALPTGGEHYWEIGRPGYPLRRLKREFAGAGFRIVSDRRMMTNYSHCFFKLQKADVSL